MLNYNNQFPSQSYLQGIKGKTIQIFLRISVVLSFLFILLTILASNRSLYANELERKFWSSYQKILSASVVENTYRYHNIKFYHNGVNYRKLYDDELEAELNNQIGRLNTFNPDVMKNDSKETKLAFWINVYNFYTIVEIKNNFPLTSMKNLGWKRPIVKVNRKLLTLDQVEHEIIRPLGEPRIHFAINCASVSCPTLQKWIYEGDKLEAQLTLATQNALRSPLNLRIEGGFFGGKKMTTTKILSWFKEDFGNTDEVVSFIQKYSPENYREFDDYSTSIFYDWDLNSQRNILDAMKKVFEDTRF